MPCFTILLLTVISFVKLCDGWDCICNKRLLVNTSINENEEKDSDNEIKLDKPKFPALPFGNAIGPTETKAPPGGLTNDVLTPTKPTSSSDNDISATMITISGNVVSQPSPGKKDSQKELPPPSCGIPLWKPLKTFEPSSDYLSVRLSNYVKPLVNCTDYNDPIPPCNICLHNKSKGNTTGYDLEAMKNLGKGSCIIRRNTFTWPHGKTTVTYYTQGGDFTFRERDALMSLAHRSELQMRGKLYSYSFGHPLRSWLYKRYGPDSNELAPDKLKKLPGDYVKKLVMHNTPPVEKEDTSIEKLENVRRFIFWWRGNEIIVTYYGDFKPKNETFSETLLDIAEYLIGNMYYKIFQFHTDPDLFDEIF